MIWSQHVTSCSSIHTHINKRVERCKCREYSLALPWWLLQIAKIGVNKHWTYEEWFCHRLNSLPLHLKACWSITPLRGKSYWCWWMLMQVLEKILIIIYRITWMLASWRELYNLARDADLENVGIAMTVKGEIKLRELNFFNWALIYFLRLQKKSKGSKILFLLLRGPWHDHTTSSSENTREVILILA